jgi:hypothetical protein
VSDVGSLPLLLIFGVGVFLTYFAARHNWGKLITIGVVGAFVNTVVIMLYAIIKRNPVGQAVLVGIVLGVLFTLMGISIGAYFRMNAPE